MKRAGKGQHELVTLIASDSVGEVIGGLGNATWRDREQERASTEVTELKAYCDEK